MRLGHPGPRTCWGEGMSEEAEAEAGVACPTSALVDSEGRPRFDARIRADVGC